MNQDQFVARRQDQWRELALLLPDLQRKSPQQLPVAVVRRCGRLYRQTASDLAYARTYFPGSPVTHFLNALVAQAHSVVYAEEPRRWRDIWRFFWSQVPATVRAAWRPFLLAALLLLAGGLVGAFAMLQDPNLAEALMPGEWRQHVATEKQGTILPVAERPMIGTQIMINNIRVGVLSFGLGVTLGLGTALVLFYNGLLLGALAAQYARAGLSLSFWALIVPHGILELTAIAVCGAAGFILGWAIVAPGDLPRRVSVAQGGRRAATLVAGTVPCFVIAAVIEGWVTPMGSLPDFGKYGVGVAAGLVGVAYLFRPSRSTAAPAP